MRRSYPIDPEPRDHAYTKQLLCAEYDRLQRKRDLALTSASNQPDTKRGQKAAARFKAEAARLKALADDIYSGLAKLDPLLALAARSRWERKV